MRSIFFIIALLLSCGYALKLSSHSFENHDEIIKVTTKEEFDQIYTSRGPIVAYFKAGSWCGLCTRLTPTINKLAGKYPNIPVVFVDIDESPDLTTEWKIEGIPTTLAIKKDGSLAGTVVGEKQALVTRLFQNLNN